jgi:methylglyoxal synthase
MVQHFRRLNMQTERKTLIAVLASHDSDERNDSLARVFERLYVTDAGALDRYHFVFTGGTFDRILLGAGPQQRITPIRAPAKRAVLNTATRLPARTEGGVTLLSYMIVRRRCSAIWPFFTPLTGHWLTPENLALMRLCDLWHVKRLMNSASVIEWASTEGITDATRNLQPCPPSIRLASSNQVVEAQPNRDGGFRLDWPEPDVPPVDFDRMTIALIAHDDMKGRMVDFAIDFENELSAFQRILATGTTGRDVADATPKLESKIYRYHSGPKGGDIEIATEVLMGHCHVVVFFVDPLRPHPHIEDIRVVFGACMLRDSVRMLTNEMQAREYMGRVVRKWLVANAAPMP